MIGRTFGHYRILEQIGAGGMGVVYRAHDERLDRDVAVKLLPPGLLADDAARRRFRHEALSLARLNHPNIATVHDAGTEEGVDFLVMEYIEGQTLTERLARGQLEAKEVVDLGRQMAAGLGAAHAQGIIHRDLKPGNLRLTRDGRLKILDFGLAQAAPRPSAAGETGTVTSTGQLTGTVPYMAPEQLMGKVADARSDIWATGAVLYELTTGQRPFPGSVLTSVAADIIHKPVRSVRYLCPDTPESLDKTILRCLEKEPERRYANAEELDADLRDGSQSGDQAERQSPAQNEALSPALEIAHILFMDIVAYSTMAMDEQERLLRELQRAVRNADEFMRAQKEDRLIRLPTGDGMALVFFGDVESPVHCALQLAESLRKFPELRLRMGIHSGPVYRIADINANRNVAGGGINMAQRVMDCGDAGHILVSKAVADSLVQVSNWRGKLTDLGEAEVKHGVRVHLFNLVQGVAGNAQTPKKLRRASQKKTLTWVASLLLIVALIGGIWLARRMGHAGKGAQRRSVAVLGLRNITARSADEWMSTGLAEMLTTELAAGEQLRAVSGEKVARMKLDLQIPQSETLSEETLSKVHRMIGSDLVVLGSYADIGGQIRVDLRLQDAKAGVTLANLSDTGSEQELFELVSRLGSELRKRCGVEDLTPVERASARATHPANLDAMRFYAEGLAHLHAFDAQGAREALSAALNADPKNALAHSAMAGTWAQLGYDSKAADEAKQAFDLSNGLAREDRLAIEAEYHVATRAWGKAIETYTALYGFFPDNPDYGLNLVDAQVSGGKATEALETIAKLRENTALGKTDPRVDLAEARVSAALSDFRRAQEASARAAKNTEVTGSLFERGEALLQQCWALRNLGQLNEAEVAGREAGEIFGADRYARGQARSLTCVGNVLNDRGETAGAKSAYQRALSLAESVGAKRDVTGALTNLGNVLANAENLAESTQSYERAMKVAEEIGDRTEVFRAQSNIGANFMVQGDFAKARTASEFALQTARELGDKSGAANTLINLGTISYDLGDLSTARQRLSNALEIARPLGLRSLVASASAALGDVQLASDEISAARTSYQDSLNIRTQIGEKNGIASSLLQLAIADLEQGTAVAAEEKARQAIQQFHDLEDLDQEAGGRAVLARVLITQKKTTEAQAEISAAEKLVPRDPTTKILLLIARSDVKANANTENKALEGLGQAIQSAKAIQFVPGELEARAARARVLAMTGQVAQARIERSQVIADATRHGFRLLARKTEMSAHP